MTPYQVLDAVAKYTLDLDELGIKPERCPAPQMLPGVLTNAGEATWVRQTVLGHARWMCDNIPRYVQDGKMEKAMRWLGFVQAILWMTGQQTIHTLKDDNR